MFDWVPVQSACTCWVRWASLNMGANQYLFVTCQKTVNWHRSDKSCDRALDASLQLLRSRKTRGGDRATQIDHGEHIYLTDHLGSVLRPTMTHIADITVIKVPGSFP